jgi:hypothetical protein
MAGMGTGMGTGTVGEAEGHDRQGWILVPPPPAITVTSAVYDPREMGSEFAASAAITVPFAMATILGNMPVCEVETAPSSDHARDQSQYNIEGGMGGGGGNSGTNDAALPVWSIKCGKFVKIGLMLLLLVAVTVIITVVVMMVGSNRDDPDPVTIITVSSNGDGNGTVVSVQKSHMTLSCSFYL